MKGQYLAIESVLTFGMGLILALGVITVFNSYKQDVMEKNMENDVTRVKAEIQNGLYSIRSAESGSIDVNLPESIGGTDYSVGLPGELRIISEQRTRSYSLGDLNRSYELSGSVEGGDLKIYKQGNQISLRAG